MAIRRISWVLPVLLLVASVSIPAQRSSFAVTGTVTEVKVSPHFVPLIDKNDEWGELRWERYERKEPWFTVSVRLQFCNNDNAAIIIPTVYSLRRGTINLLFLDLPAQDSPVSATANLYIHENSRQFVDPIPAFVKELEKADPSGYSFAVIEPGTCYDAMDFVSVRSGYKVQTRPSPEKRQRPIEIVTPEYSQFKIRYSLSMKDSLPVSEAKRRWGHLGKLLTTSDGDFFFETDVIINKLPELTPETL